MTQTTTALTHEPAHPLALMPVFDIQQAVERRNGLVKFVQTIMHEGTDYGVIPGTERKPAAADNGGGAAAPSSKNNTLLKPGAEKLCSFFGLTPRFAIIERVEDWTGAGHGGEPLFYYFYKCQLVHGAHVVAEGDGSCNSREKKYRYRRAERACPKCGRAAILKSRDDGGGFFCWRKKDGCGATFAEADPRIVEQVVGQVPNPDVADQVNTLQKMAQKRALIAATLIAVNASEFFTQDVEDMEVIEGEWSAPPQTPQQQTPDPQRIDRSTSQERRPPARQPSNAPAVAAAGQDLADDKTFVATFKTVLAARPPKFTAAEAQKVLDNVLSRAGHMDDQDNADLTRAGVKWRQGCLDAAAKGTFDKHAEQLRSVAAA
jgi:hypothetical protein